MGELEQLRRWKTEATSLFDGLQDLGRALGLPLGVLVTGPAAVEAATRLRADRDALAAAVDRVRRRHPRGDEEPGPLAPGLWCPTCGRERSENGWGACPDRAALSHAEPPQSAEENAGGSECHRGSSGRENGREGRSGGIDE